MKIFFKEFVILIFSRSNSLRLKNKYKLSVGKYDLIEIPIIRLKKIFSEKMIKLCIPSNNYEDYLDYSIKHDIEIFHGPEKDLMKRVKNNIGPYKYFIRVTGDDPLTSPEIILKFIKCAQTYKYDYIYTESISDGLIPEMISKRYLNFLYPKVIDKSSSSHLSYYFIRNFKNYKKCNLFLPYQDISNISLSVDYQRDLKILDWLLRKINFNIKLNDKKLISLIREHKKYLNKFRKRKYFNLKTKDYDVSLKGKSYKRFYY